MGEEFEVLSKKSTKYLQDSIITSRLAHWTCKGDQYYSDHKLYARVYKDTAGLMDTHIESLRACGFMPDFSLFSGPGITLGSPSATELAELVLDYLMAANSSMSMFFRFCDEHSHDPRLVGLADHLGGASSVLLVDMYLMQSRLGF